MAGSLINWQDPVFARDWIQNKTRSGNQTRVEQIAILIELISVLQADGHRILDLGCGDAAISEMLLTRFPSSYVVGLDVSSPMLEEARARLSPFAGRFTLLAHDLREAYAALFDLETFDVVVGIQSVHHLTAGEKQDLFKWVSLLLRDGGLFLLADRVKLASAALFPFHLRLWDRLQRISGDHAAAPGYSYDDHLVGCAMRGDMPDTSNSPFRFLPRAEVG
ncbi:MAG: class I SAM-dependent methyltransferase [Chloroflexi bacterium]|nr:class I SAM-dependent methyltransferase [Chloroflexota bacterium]